MTVENYEKLSENDKLWYEPDYEKYHVKKVRCYESCDLGYTHFMGWVEERIPIGKPFKYHKVDAFTHNLRLVNKLTQPKIIDSLLSSNVLMNRALNKNQNWSN